MVREGLKKAGAELAQAQPKLELEFTSTLFPMAYRILWLLWGGGAWGLIGPPLNIKEGVFFDLILL